MKILILSLKFFIGAIVVFALGWFIGYLLKLDKKYEEMREKQTGVKRSK